MISIIKPFSLYTQLPNIYLVVGFEFRPQRIWRFSLRVSVVREWAHFTVVPLESKSTNVIESLVVFVHSAPMYKCINDELT